MVGCKALDDTVLLGSLITEADDTISISAVLDGGRPAFLIGSDPRSHLQLAGADASHALIIRRQNAYFIQPRLPGVTVLVNGKRISGPTCLLPDDTVEIAGTRLRFDQQEGPPPAPRPSLPPPTPRPAAVVPTAPVRPAVVAAVPEAVVYYPRAAESTRPSYTGLLVGLMTILAIAGVVLYGLFSGLNQTAAPPALNFAYNDGNVTLVMFDADW